MKEEEDVIEFLDNWWNYQDDELPLLDYGTYTHGEWVITSPPYDPSTPPPGPFPYLPASPRFF